MIATTLNYQTNCFVNHLPAFKNYTIFTEGSIYLTLGNQFLHMRYSYLILLQVYTVVNVVTHKFRLPPNSPLSQTKHLLHTVRSIPGIEKKYIYIVSPSQLMLST